MAVILTPSGEVMCLRRAYQRFRCFRRILLRIKDLYELTRAFFPLCETQNVSGEHPNNAYEGISLAQYPPLA
jgi:hypothetical protein